MLDGRSVVIFYTDPDEEPIRILSLRKAISYERKHCEECLKNGLD